jgi:invasion protein IalB
MLCCATLVSAQTPKVKGAAPAPQATSAPAPQAEPSAPPPSWVARCGSTSREAPLECAVEESAVLAKTGQLVVLVNIRVTPTPIRRLPWCNCRSG